MITYKKVNLLEVKIFQNRLIMGIEAAKEASDYIKEQFKTKKELNIVFAAAPSQNEFLAALVESKDVDWSRINAFHMDEYIGLVDDAPQGFGNFLRDAIFSKLPFQSVHYLHGQSPDPESICKQYAGLLKSNPIDIVFMGIGENGHIAFNDPHVAFFDDQKTVKVVDLDETCRIQQVNDGCFSSLDQVPTHAVTLTIPTLMSAKRLFCVVPDNLKANAVRETVMGDISEHCPATILRTHPAATLYCDRDSAVYIN